MKIIKTFKNDYAFLSNFFNSPITVNGQVWKTAEHLFQAIKTLNKEEREKIRLSDSPGIAKKLGRKVKLRDDWEEIKIDGMETILTLKFNQNPLLIKKLLDTDNKLLIEGNYWHDNIWGNCYCQKCKNVKGQNQLGIILMKLRYKFKTNKE